MSIGNGIRIGGSSSSWKSYWANKDWGNYFCAIKSILPNKDTLITNNHPTYNYGTGINLVAGEYNNAVAVARSLIDFDLSAIKDDYKLQNVYLKLYVSSSLSDNTRKIQVFRLKRTWVEGTKNGSAPADGATWTTCDGINNWTEAGAFNTADCEQISIGEYEVSNDSVGDWISIPLLVTSKAELTLGYGFLLKMEVENNDCYIFRSLNEGFNIPYLEYEVNGVINGTTDPRLNQVVENPIITGAFGSVWQNDVNNYEAFYTNLTNVLRAISTDGVVWTPDAVNNPVLRPIVGVGNMIDCVSFWKESGVYYMLYRSNEWGGWGIGLATSINGITWTKSASNPVLTPTEAWEGSKIDPWGVIKVGITYYLWINNVNVIPRQSGVVTSTDLINWTRNVNNPIFENGRYCSAPIKYKGKYYLFMPYTPKGNVSGAAPLDYRIELYRDSNPTFLTDEREYLGNILIGGIDGTWDDDYLDTPSILTTNINRDTYPVGTDKDGKLWMYYTGHSGAVWSHGLAIGHLEMLDKLMTITEPAAGE
jgi:hypothetical protein